MIFIEKNKLNLYRYAVGKIVFLKLYSHEYSFVDNIVDTNCIVVESNDKKKIVVSLFGQPNSNRQSYDYPVVAFVQKKSENRAKKMDNCRFLSSEFDTLFDKYIIMSMLDQREFFSSIIKDDYRFYDLFSEIIGKPFSWKESSESVFKYYNDQTYQNRFNRLDGDITFSDPATFNDPFDCNCLFANGNSVTDLFRVFCSIPYEKDILMWSYYASDHKGYCFEYSKKDILAALSPIQGCICIMGTVDYDDSRPDYRLNNNQITFNNLKKIINCTFTKSLCWEHEDEYRFLLIGKLPQHFQLQVNIKNVFLGCRCTHRTIRNSQGVFLNTIPLSIDPFEYKLN